MPQQNAEAIHCADFGALRGSVGRAGAGPLGKGSASGEYPNRQHTGQHHKSKLGKSKTTHGTIPLSAQKRSGGESKLPGLPMLEPISLLLASQPGDERRQGVQMFAGAGTLPLSPSRNLATCCSASLNVV